MSGMNWANTPVVVLCGGRGTRLQEHTQTIPKPLAEIGGRPILWHVIQIYAVQGFRPFVLCTGRRGELIEDFVAGEDWPDGVEPECVVARTRCDHPRRGRTQIR
jgi:glucose-1-phosphate cytidylyltransferase